MAIRNITAGEELSYDYGQRRDAPEWMKCRKVIYCTSLELSS